MAHEPYPYLTDKNSSMLKSIVTTQTNFPDVPLPVNSAANEIARERFAEEDHNNRVMV
jgi:hypothetical protein